MTTGPFEMATHLRQIASQQLLSLYNDVELIRKAADLLEQLARPCPVEKLGGGTMSAEEVREACAVRCETFGVHDDDTDGSMWSEEYQDIGQRLAQYIRAMPVTR